MKKSLTKAVRQNMQFLAEIAGFHVKAVRHSRDLQARQKNLTRIRPNDILLFAVMKNEAHRLPFFLDYYRRLGVNHFILVDNGSTDHFADVVSGQADVSTYYTTASYKESNFGMYWANYLLLRFGSGHWCLTCDPDEFLVYPYMETRDLRDLTDYLSSRLECSFFTVQIDMYSDKAVEESRYREGDDPLNTCSYFDATGYSKSFNPNYRNTFVQGGVRRRMFYSNNPVKAPALNKVPLIKWESHYAYVESMHMAIPRRLNRTLSKIKTSGALLHFKFISQLVEKVKEERIAKQHYDNSSEYKKYDQAIETKTRLYDPYVSTRFEGWQTLAKFGLINVGEW
jgi:glycosyltransferase involved in cell wall biosynthesis